MSRRTRAKRIEERRLERIKPGDCNTTGNKPEPSRRWNSATIMRYAGKFGMVSVRTSRKLCGYRHLTPSKYP